MNLFRKKQDTLDGTMEFSYIIYNSDTGDIKTKRFCVPTYTDVVSFQNNFINYDCPSGYRLLATPFHRYNSEIEDINEFKSCGKPMELVMGMLG